MSECTERYSTERRHNAHNSVSQEIEYILKSVEYTSKSGDTFQQVGTVIAAKIALENIMKDWEGQDMKMCEEMIKLRKELDVLGIKWRDVSTIDERIKKTTDIDVTMYRTHFDTYNRDTRKSYEWSVIFGTGSYGEEEKLLECMSSYYDTDDGVIGYQTADEIIKAVKESIGIEEDKNNNNDENAEKWRHFELTT